MRLAAAAALGCGLAVLAAAAPEREPAEKDRYWVYVGAYTGGASKGVTRFEFDADSGKLTNGTLVAELTNPTFLALRPDGLFLYAVNETADFGDKKTGAVTAFSIDPKTGALKRLNQQSSGGAGACHLVVDRKGQNVLVANYGGGSVAVLPIGDDGQLKEASAFVQHKGKGANPDRQEGPHAHSMNVDLNNRFAVAADLGLDKVLVYRFDPAKGTLTANDPPAFEAAPGAGPRHFAFHPDGKHAYVIDELDLTLTALGYDADKGVLKKIATYPTMPKDAKREGASTAEVQVHPSGKFVYGSNRGHNSIVAFAVDGETGELTNVGWQGEGIKKPRAFGIDPSGQWMLVANEDGDNIVVFRIDGKTGELKATGEKVETPKPVCVKFLAKGS
jgi:6-phosphogluconolactonase